MPVTHKPTNVVNSPFIRYSGTSAYTDLIREFLLLIGVKHCLTLAYSKEENAIVERYNEEINRHLRASTYDNKLIRKNLYRLCREFCITIAAID